MGDSGVRAARWMMLAALVVILAVTGYWLLFTTFMIYDDEGYVLLSLKNFSAHGGLYDVVYTQYGPFPYLLYDALHRLFGFAYDNTSGRLITLINWLGTALACGIIVDRVTRSVTLAAFSLVATFVYLWVMINEPLHPGSLITVIVSVATWQAMEAWQKGNLVRFSVIVGIAGAALVLTKINVGLFFVIAGASWLALNAGSPKFARALTWMVTVVCAILPVGLMWALLSAPWVRLFALVFMTGILGLILTSPSFREYTILRRHGVWFCAAFATSCAAIVLGISFRGTSTMGLIDGILIEPLKHPGVYFFPVKWAKGAEALALASLLFAATSAWTRPWSSPWWKHSISAVRVVASIFCLCAPTGIMPTTFATWGLSYGVPLAWVFVVPVGEKNHATKVRAWIALVFVLQALHVYPVAGSQLNWGTFLWVPLMALGLHDALPIVQSWLPRFSKWSAVCARAAFACITLYMTVRLCRIGFSQYQGSQPLGLPGAENLRLPNDLTYALRVADLNLRSHADMLFSFPGTYSANLWTGLPTPSLSNATHWFSLLSPSRQQEIIQRLDATPRAAILVQRELVDYLIKHGFSAHGPLYDWLMSHFEKSLAFGGYEIWIRHGRTLAGLMLAHVGHPLPGGMDALTLTMPAPNSPIARFELCNIEQPDHPLAVLDGHNATASIVPCGSDGRPLGPDQPALFPFKLNTTSTVVLRFSVLGVNAKFDRLLLVARDPTGTKLGELLVVE